MLCDRMLTGKRILGNRGRFELVGAFGDLPLLLPLLSGLVVVCHLDAVSVFTLIGLAYLGCGLYYRIPLPIQPLKAVAAIAIAQRLNPEVIFAGGLLMGVFFLTLSFSPSLLTFLSKIFPQPVILGIQLSLGLLLFRVASELLFAPPVFFTSVVLPQNRMYFNLFSFPNLADFGKAAWLLVIPQIPLSVGNSLFATVDAAEFYFGKRAKKVTLKHLSFDLGIINILSGLLGGAPVCHGSNGLTAHYRFGARSGQATIFLGLLLLLLVFIFRNGINTLFRLVPLALFGVLLFYVGFQHALLAKRSDGGKGFLVVLTTGLTTLITGNLAAAFLAGVISYFCLFHKKNVRNTI